ncbi:zinc-binding dehydrogenase [Actinomadura keratinilytica]
MSTPWAAITGTGDVRPGEAVGVWGVGGLGAHGVQLLRAIGAYPVVAVDPAPAARERALAFGADASFDAADPELRAKVLALAGGTGLAAAFDFAGVPSRARTGADGARPEGPAGTGRAHRPSAHRGQRHALQLPPAADPRPLRVGRAPRAAAGGADRRRPARLLPLGLRGAAPGTGGRGGPAHRDQGGRPGPAGPAPLTGAVRAFRRGAGKLPRGLPGPVRKGAVREGTGRSGAA